MAKTNMGISDAEFTSAAKTISSYGEELVNLITQYQQAVKLICDTAIQDQLICGNLYRICEQIDALKQPISDLTSQAATKAKNYVDAIDSADKFLY